ncbi:MAG: MFS transporter [Pseudomonadota bacterium]
MVHPAGKFRVAISAIGYTVLISPAYIPPQAGHQIVTISALFAAYFGGVGVFIPFFPVWLQSIGLSTGWIAVVVAAPLLVRVATTSLVSDWAERFGDPRRPLRVMALLALALFALLPMAIVVPALTFLLAGPYPVLIIVAAMSVGWNAVLPLSDALAIQVSRATGAAYGRLRLWGSLAFIVVSTSVGWMVATFGVGVVPWIILAHLFAFYVVAILLPRAVVSKSESITRKKRSGWLFFFRRKGAMSVFIGVALIQASHAVLYSFGSLSWGQQGFSESAIGALWALGVAVEIALFAVSKPIIAHIGARGLLLVGGSGAVLRWIALATTPDLVLTIPLQVLHGFSFAMTFLALIAYVERRARPNELRAAQGVFAVISGAIMGLATLAAGPLFEAFGPVSYLAMAGMASIGTAVLLVNRLTVPAGLMP